jgi:hypothetical protein
MICPECNHKYSGAGCPRCATSKGVVKTSTILISAGETRAVYRSVDEMPDSLKRQLLRSTNGPSSATIVIADRKGRKQVARAIRSLPVAGPSDPAVPAVRSDRVNFSLPVLRLTVAALALTVAVLLWVTFQ